jgi:6-phosphogluconolactonase
MKILLILFTLLFLNLLSFAQTNKQVVFYVGTFTSEGGEGILRCGLNTETGEIQVLETFKGIDNPAFLKISGDKSFLIAGTTPAKNADSVRGYVSVYKIGEKGSLKFINKQVSKGNEPCHVDVSKDNKWVAAANYGSGTLALFPVSGDGKLQPASSVIVNQGSGPDLSRQAGPHAHSVKFSPFTNEVFSADLGTDQLDIFRLENGQLVQKDQKFVKMNPGAGPRHFDFHPSGKFIYVINELNSTVTLLAKENGTWVKKQNYRTLPGDFAKKSYCADIHLSKDGRFLYGSNRGHNSIVVFSVNPDNGELKTVGFVQVEGNWPRNFGISPDGAFLLVANQRSANITVFRINQQTGLPEFAGKQLKTGSPVCIEFL